MAPASSTDWCVHHVTTAWVGRAGRSGVWEPSWREGEILAETLRVRGGVKREETVFLEGGESLRWSRRERPWAPNS